MNIQYLIYANTIIIIVYIFFTRIYKTKIIIDHFALLLAGIIFYWLMPIYVCENDLTSHQYLIEFYKNIPIENIEMFLYFTLLIVFSILLSDYILSKFPVVISVNNYCYSKRILDLFFWFIFICTCISAYYMRNIFFHGYEITGAWPFERGWFISGCVSLITLNVIYSWTQITKPIPISRRKLLIKLIINKYFISAFLFNILMLSTGNRGYIVSFMISLLLIYIEINRGIKLRNLTFITGLIVVFTSYVAIKRSDGIFSLTKFIDNFFYEALNVGKTLFYHLQDMDYNLVEFPTILISKLIGIIPSVIFPGKFALMVYPEDIGKIVKGFQGTTHNYVELIINFGLIGTILFFFFLGIGFNWLKSKKHYTPIYIAASANIPFFFFRSFYDATVKHILEFSIILPLLILFISYAYRKYIT